MHNQHIKINRLPRDPEKFDVLDLFDAIGRKSKLVLGDEKDEAKFVDKICNALSKNKTPTMIYGRRVEAMFAYMVASLGKCVIVKKEDCGDVFVGNHRIKIPDYRIVLGADQNEQMLVEVKNYYQQNEFDEYYMNADYLDNLSRYSNLVKTDLRIAIYWSKWSLWTLISPDDFERNETKAVITFSSAVKRNQMSALGDVVIGTTPPLAIRMYPDKQKPHIISENNMTDFTIGRVEMLCNNTPITIEYEQRIACALMLFGNWEESIAVFTSPHSENEIEYIEFLYSPQQDDEQQGIYPVIALSSIISRQYGELTAPDGKVQRISPDISPEMLGFVIPDGYKGEALPLLRLHIQPRYD